MYTLAHPAPTHRFLVCVDSDGCVFDTMEVKHKECFCPAYVDAFSLQGISRYARDAWDYTNLYSKSRGMHRFLTLLMSLDLLRERREVVERGFRVPDHEALRKWIAQTPRLSNDALAEACARDGHDPILDCALTWSYDVNDRVKKLVHGVPPFPNARVCLQAMADFADIVVVSATQEAALLREWEEHDLLRTVSCVCGQESGSKKEVLRRLSELYPELLMIGDAPGDHAAADACGARFYPIRPNEESESWGELLTLLPRLAQGGYTPEVQASFVERFDRCLPDTVPWETV